MKQIVSRSAGAFVAIGLTVALTACSGGSLTVSGGAGQVQVGTDGAAKVQASDGTGVSIGADGSAGVNGGTDAADPSASSDGSTGGSTDGSAGASAGGSAAGGDVVLPEFPAPRVPDISAMTAAAGKTEKAIAASVPLPPGVQVVGARCDSKGYVVNRTGLTVGGGDDGSQIVARAGVSQVGAGGAGQLVSGSVTYQVNADGSGQVVAGASTVQVNADGSGQFTDGDLTYQVNADGTGQYTHGDETYQVEPDGSGTWTSSAGVVTNAGDGSGTWVGTDGPVTVNGDGTGTKTVTPIKVAPMAKFALLGKFPKLTKLKPVGKACGTLIRLSAGVLFDFDKDTLRPSAVPLLAAVAKALQGSTKAIQVNGHTDSKGDDAYNLDLSQRRAATVAKALQGDGLAAPLTIHGFGETQPVAPNTVKGADNPVGRQLNRRVELVIP